MFCRWYSKFKSIWTQLRGHYWSWNFFRGPASFTLDTVLNSGMFCLRSVRVETLELWVNKTTSWELQRDKVWPLAGFAISSWRILDLTQNAFPSSLQICYPAFPFFPFFLSLSLSQSSNNRESSLEASTAHLSTGNRNKHLKLSGFIFVSEESNVWEMGWNCWTKLNQSDFKLKTTKTNQN